MSKYVVTARNRDGKKIVSQVYNTKADAQHHASETKKYKSMKNPRIKKIA